jgi:hypothetical protein
MAKVCATEYRSDSSETSSFQPSAGVKHAAARFRFCVGALALFMLSCLTAGACHAQSRDVVCSEGAGEFEALSQTGVTVRVGAARNRLLAERVCEAVFSWGDQNLVVADSAWQVDLDAFGVDLGLGVPAVALQVKKSKAECCMAYNIYSLRTPPVLLHSIRGGMFFSAADTDLDGRVEIWTDDAASVDGFENIRLSDLDFAPPVILRFEQGRLLDASSDFRPFFDQKIADVRTMLDPKDLADFKNSDGKLASASAYPVAQLLRLRIAKIRVLEIVWSYLYSGREREAMRSLGEMWPDEDTDRIRAAILKARAGGIHAQLDGVATVIPPKRRIQAKIFDGTTTLTSTPGLTPKDMKPKPVIIQPVAILMLRPPPATAQEAELAQTEAELKLVIDSAGKVRTVEVLGNAQSMDEGLVKSTSNWKFIPAFSDGAPVASQIFLGVSLKR